MERCPNCGAPARPGAKFCTTCGYRLPTPTVVPISTENEPAASTDTAPASSWPAPPSSVEPPSQPEEESVEVAVTAEGETSSDDVVAPPPASTGDEVRDTAESTSEESTDSILSSSWPSAPSSVEPSPWSTGQADAGAETATETRTTDEVVTEEVVVVPEPASQYEGWSSAVVEEVAPATTAHGTTIARATALLDELRLLLPALHSGAGGGQNPAVAAELESAVATSDATAGDRQGLRDALNEARDNPRDIQTILALSQQVDAAISLLDDHDRLVAAIRQAITTLTTPEGEQS